MAHAFASQEWADELLALARRDSLLRSHAETWVHGPVLLVVDSGDDVPEALGLRLDLHEGEVRELAVVEPTAELAARTPFGVAGSLARWKSLVGGEVDLVDAILEAKVRVRISRLPPTVITTPSSERQRANAASHAAVRPTRISPSTVVIVRMRPAPSVRAVSWTRRSSDALAPCTSTTSKGNASRNSPAMIAPFV